jgi:glycosyltransferase involved in cell wall biosynthesis
MLPPSIDFLLVGRRERERGWSRVAARLVSDSWNLRKTLRSRRYDLVHLNPSLGAKALLRDAANLMLARRARVPVLVFVHGWDQDTEALMAGPWLPIFRRTFLNADAMIVLASRFERRLRGFGYAGPIHLVATAVPEEAFRSAPRRTRRRTGGARLLYMSRFEPRKGAVETIRAFALLKRRHPDAALTLAGSGPEQPALLAAIQDLGVGDVTLPGHVTGADKARALSEADIFVFPTSYGEGMPTVVLEAMAEGLPVVTRAVGGLADFFEPGRMGYAADSNDPHEIASLIERLLMDPEARLAMGEYNRDFARRHFHARVAASRLLSIYEQTTAEAGSRRELA